MIDRLLMNEHRASPPPSSQPRVILDIGGEGRHPRAWNLNPSPVKTIGLEAGRPIPRRIAGRAEHIPLPSASVSVVFVERTPLRLESLAEILRVVRPNGLIILRHARPPWSDPHTLAIDMMGKPIRRRRCHIGDQSLQESVFRRASLAASDSGFTQAAVSSKAHAGDIEELKRQPGHQRFFSHT